MLIDINIGSNLGDRRHNIARAVDMISRRWPQARVYLSDYVESEPWGYQSANSYLNRGILLVSPEPLDPIHILDALQHIERTISPDPHRNPDGTYRDRLIDIDIIAIDNLTLRTPRLTLPHPRSLQRPFVTGPMQQVHALYQADTQAPKP